MLHKIIIKKKFKKKININIIVSRYNEDLEWLNNEPFNKYFIICYNKGVNNNFKINSPHKIIKLDNIGKCDHTYLYHIINNYNNLPDIMIFLPGSNDINYKLDKSILLIRYIDYFNELVNLGEISNNHVRNIFYNFKLDTWKTSHSNNLLINTDINTKKAKIRPFGKWYDFHFKNNKINFISWWGIFAISNDIVRQKPIEYYNIFLEELSVSSNPEVGHYIERSWCAIFNLTNSKIINYTPN